MAAVDIAADPRFVRGVSLFNDGEYLEASDLFEDLFFEGVRDEPDFVRIFLQFSVGIHHAQTGQWRPAVARIEEGLRLVGPTRRPPRNGSFALVRGIRTDARNVRHKVKPRR